MENIDFNKYKKKYSSLDDEDISLLNNFFNQEDIKNNIDNGRVDSTHILEDSFIDIKEYFKSFISQKKVFLVVIVGLLILFIAYSIPQLRSALVGILVFLFIIKFLSFYTKNLNKEKNSIKINVIEKFINYLSDNLTYSKDNTQFPDSLEHIKDKTTLLKSDFADYFRDSISYEYKYNENSISIFGAEVGTSDRYADNNGSLEDHCYLTKIKFNNSRYNIDNFIMIEGINSKYNTGNYVFVDIIKNIFFITVTFLILLSILYRETEKGSLINFIYLNFDKISGEDKFFIIFSILIMIIFILIPFIKKLIKKFIKNKKKVDINNYTNEEEFQNNFKVYINENSNNYPMLTSSFFKAIMDFCKSMDSYKKFSFYIEGNEVYIKRDIEGEFMQKNISQSLINSLEDYVIFYINLKESKKLGTDLAEYFYEGKSFSDIDFSK